VTQRSEAEKPETEKADAAPALTAAKTAATTVAKTAKDHWYRGLQRRLMHFAVSGLLPVRWMYPKVPSRFPGKTGRLKLEIVSHCWRYSHLQAYQLSSLIQHPPRALDVVMTVYYSEEDTNTVRMLNYFEQHKVPGVSWNWRALPKEQLFRRGIGRNHAALNTNADWIWHTDCDVMFNEDALDTLAEALQGCEAPLVFPHAEKVTELLEDDDPMLQAAQEPRIVDMPEGAVSRRELKKATGPVQIQHGDAARQFGYCNATSIYLVPAQSWAKCHEDRVFRWMMGTQGMPLTIPNVCRIRHISKGRYTGTETSNKLRTWVRKIQFWFRDRKHRQ